MTHHAPRQTRILRNLSTGLVFCLGAVAPIGAHAQQEAPDLMVVLDGSGSMWGQIGGRTKMDLAREALSGVLSEAGQNMQIGLMAYGHRQKGKCGDIELMVPMGPAMQTVPAIIDRAYGVRPRGMTPIVDSVLAAAEGLSYSERAATVVLLTDGIETCGGDPCALGRMLEEKGVKFTAHVVGFDMTDAEQRQVACLAHETGGLFIAANDAGGLGAALRDTILADLVGPVIEYVPPPPPPPEPVIGPRMVEFYLRDVADGPVLISNAFRDVRFLALDEGGAVPPAIAMRVGDKPWTLDGAFLPGRYEIQIERLGPRQSTIRTALMFEVPEGVVPHQVDLVIAARLHLTALAHAGLPLPQGSGNLPSATYGTASGRADFTIHPVIGGAIDPGIDYGGVNSLDVALPPGDYFIRGTLAKTFAMERLIHVPPGQTLDYTFDFGASRVFVSLADAQGGQVAKQVTRFLDGPAARWFMYGGGGDGNPFYLPQGTWRIEVYNDQRSERAEGILAVPGNGQDAALTLRDGEGLTDQARQELAARHCLAYEAQGNVCLVETVTPARIARELPSAAFDAGALSPQFTGTWDVEGLMMALVQDGRRVWGDVWKKGGREPTRLYGEIAADGLTMRGTIQGTGIFEFRLATDGLAFSGGSAHFGGGDTGTRVHPALDQTRYVGRKLSAGRPAGLLADGSEADLHPAFRGGAVPAFEDFMVTVRGAAPAGTEGDLGAMQAVAQMITFGGGWKSQHGLIQFHQEGRTLRGTRDQGVLEGEISADGRLLRGTWTNDNGRWGLFEFRLNPESISFEGIWDYTLSTAFNQSSWNGERAGWLPTVTGRALTSIQRHPGATGPEFDAFMQAVRDPDLKTDAGLPPGQGVP